jgi:uncharacterized protein (DUF1499 family)
MMLSRKFIEYTIRTLIVLMLSLIVFRIWVIIADHPPISVGVVDGKLYPCPRTPNCVSTQETRRGFRAEPVPFRQHPDSIHKKLLAWFDARINATVLTADSSYFHAAFKVPILGTYDDFEIFIERDKQLLQIRSLSRTGPFNFGLNRLRIRRIRAVAHRQKW